MNTSLTDLTALLTLFKDLQGGSGPGDPAVATALQQIGQAVVDYVAMEEAERAQELADKPKEEAMCAAKLAAMQAIPQAIGGMASALAQALADRPAATTIAAPAPSWTRLQINVNQDRMGRMESFTIEKVA